jgi:hypothetical protein
MALSRNLRALIPGLVRNSCRSELDRLLIEIASACEDYAEEIEKDEFYVGNELDINRLRSLAIALYHVVRNQGLGNEPVCEQTIIHEED